MAEDNTQEIKNRHLSFKQESLGENNAQKGNMKIRLRLKFQKKPIATNNVAQQFLLENRIIFYSPEQGRTKAATPPAY